MTIKVTVIVEDAELPTDCLTFNDVNDIRSRYIRDQVVLSETVVSVFKTTTLDDNNVTTDTTVYIPKRYAAVLHTYIQVVKLKLTTLNLISLLAVDDVYLSLNFAHWLEDNYYLTMVIKVCFNSWSQLKSKLAGSVNGSIRSRILMMLPYELLPTDCRGSERFMTSWLTYNRRRKLVVDDKIYYINVPSGDGRQLRNWHTEDGKTSGWKFSFWDVTYINNKTSKVVVGNNSNTNDNTNVSNNTVTTNINPVEHDNSQVHTVDTPTLVTNSDATNSGIIASNNVAADNSSPSDDTDAVDDVDELNNDESVAGVIAETAGETATGTAGLGETVPAGNLNVGSVSSIEDGHLMFTDVSSVVASATNSLPTETLVATTTTTTTTDSLTKNAVTEGVLKFRVSKVHLVDGELDGTSVAYWSNGIPREVGQWKRGKRHGSWQHYRKSDGRLLNELTYVDGLREGLYVSYSRTFREVGNYIADKRIGCWRRLSTVGGSASGSASGSGSGSGNTTTTDSNIVNSSAAAVDSSTSTGGLLRESNYVDDQLHGLCINYFSDTGRIKGVLNYKNNKLHGEYIHYRDDTQHSVHRIETYVENKRESNKYYPKSDIL